MKKFPEKFLWGAAASAPQTEGAALTHGKTESTWDFWYAEDPRRFFNQVGPEHTSNVYQQYQADGQLMADMSLNSYRTSISWARLLPDGQTINEEAVTFYRDYFTTLINHGVEPVINLFHFDMPMWLMKKGGWETRESVSAFAFYAKTAFDLFGDIVKKWATFNEPMVHIDCGYLGEFHYPGVVDFKRAVQVGFHTVLAHAHAVAAFRQSQYRDGAISCILNLSPVYTKENPNHEDLEAQRLADLIQIRSLLDPIVLGHFPDELITLFKKHGLLPVIAEGDLTMIANNTVDFLGVNYYQPLRVQHQDQPAIELTPQSFFKGYEWPDRRINPHRGWEIFPEGIYEIAMRVKNDYGNIPWFISENGMGVEGEEQFLDDQGIVQDDYRIAFISDHLEFLHQAITAGSNCFGYHLWTFVDCWSWLNGYKNRYGFYRVDLTDNFKRYPKKSSFWFKSVIEQNGLS